MHDRSDQSGSGIERLRALVRPTEQRTEPRHYSGRGAVICQRPGQASAAEVAVIWDVSQGGLGLFMSSPRTPGTALYIKFQDAAVRARMARVIHATPAEGGWMLGCELDCPLTEAELEALREPGG
jgi:hypothetical protein